MDLQKLSEKCRMLQSENRRLKEKIKLLEKQIRKDTGYAINEVGEIIIDWNQTIKSDDAKEATKTKTIDKRSSPNEKIHLFKSLFKGREDVFATRWENSKKGTSGYSPACRNEWIQEICQKPKIKCAVCKNKDYLKLNNKIIEDHLRGKIVVGIYPLLPEETCWFLAIDFDGEEWQKDITTIRKICSEFTIPVAVERSRSGNGAHAWFFFERPVPASTARKFGSALLTYTMNQRPEIKFKSYDRFFPNQDTMPKGGFGNLIALPLQKKERDRNNSVFIDKDFQPFKDQWAFLSSVERLSQESLEYFSGQLCQGNELGILKMDDEEVVPSKPWEMKKSVLLNNDFPKAIEIVKANMLYIPKRGISPKALNRIKRLAAFKNPDFYKAQAMRLSTFNKPRIISCADETEDHIHLPRGCEDDLKNLLKKVEVKPTWIDKTNPGKKIDIRFNGTLRDEQPFAVANMLAYKTGVLCGTTAFGKTIAAIKLIAEKKVNTLILVNKVSLVNQWKKKLNEFLTVDKPIEMKNKRSKEGENIFGQIGNGKQIRSDIIDIALMQSLSRMGEVKEFVKDYGLVIVDECHHVPAFSFESILKNVSAKYVYGLTATPSRKDGHHPIISMHCGPIRYRDDAKKQAEKRPFSHYIIPRFTSFRINSLAEKEEKEWTIQELYAEIVKNEIRNQMIADDVIECHQKGKNCIVLTERVKHVKILSEMIRNNIPCVISVTGGMGNKVLRETMQKISESSKDNPLTIVATGRFIGEGFDEPRLDTLFLAMPISWKGTLQQYAGRLHRLFEGKKEALIFDYIDVRVRMFERMYNRRLTGYASIGYKMKGELFSTTPQKEENVDIIFDKNNFYPVFSNDLLNATHEILIISPFITKRRTLQIMRDLEPALAKNVKVIVVTRSSKDLENKNLTAWTETTKQMKAMGISLVYKPKIHQKFAIIDQKTIWYGSINLLSYGNAEESMMRIKNTKIAFELIESIEKIAGQGTG
jgi:superfamily II DNA or RNA helicase